MTVLGDGPVPARLMIVGEAPGEQEDRAGRPFIGASGQELDRMLHEAGLMRSLAYTTNVCKERPPGNDMGAWVSLKKKGFPPEWPSFRQGHVHPHVKAGIDHLMKEISLVQPNVILALGNVSLWTLTGLWGISKWRGSELRVDWASEGPIVIPAYHPAYILRDWAERACTVRDFRRVAARLGSRELPTPGWKFLIRPSFEQAAGALHHILGLLAQGPTKLVHDLETRSGHIACSGIAWSATEAVCIPFMDVSHPAGYWTEEQEAELVALHKAVLTHPNARVVNQNYLYDAQYIWRWWCFRPRFWRDTMISHHVAFCELPKAVDYQASLYCDSYRYWKDDSRDWDPKVGEDQLWYYNCEDCVRTWEVDEATAATIQKLGLQAVNDFQQALFWPTFEAMALGIRQDPVAKAAMRKELGAALVARQEWLNSTVGHDVDFRSPAKLMKLFYEDFKQPVSINKKTKKPTLNEEALLKIAKREPLLAPITKRIIEARSIGVFSSTFVDARLDLDGRLRCSFNPCGTYTFRYSSSKNAFWNGTNLQNIPKGVEAKEPEDLELPNIRKLFVPDPGYTFFDLDLDRADLQVVIWEAADAEMKAMLREGVDMHVENAKLLGCTRQLAKVWVHGTNYGGGARTMAQTCGLTVHQAERMQARWFAAHPGIKRWHERTKKQAESGFITNIFGYKRFLFDRLDLPDCLAWQPQSVVGRVINTAWQNLYREAPWIWVQLQVHDSLAGSFPTARKEEATNLLRTLSQVVIPYPDPLVIPTGLKTSELSWGDCQ